MTFTSALTPSESALLAVDRAEGGVASRPAVGQECLPRHRRRCPTVRRSGDRESAEVPEPITDRGLNDAGQQRGNRRGHLTVGKMTVHAKGSDASVCSGDEVCCGGDLCEAWVPLGDFRVNFARLFTIRKDSVDPGATNYRVVASYPNDAINLSRVLIPEIHC